MAKITIHIANPWTGAWAERDITDLTQTQLDGYAGLMSDEDINAVWDQLGPTASAAAFLAAWVERVGPEEAGRVILGS